MLLVRLVGLLSFVVVFISIYGQTSYGQTRNVGQITSQLDYERDLAEQLRPFEELYQIALRNSPVVKEQEAQIEYRLEETRLTKLSLLNGIGASGSYSAGNQSLVAIGPISSDNLQISSGYRVGVQANLSLGDLVGMRGRVRLHQAQYRTALARRDNARQSLKREINELYQTLLTNQRILKINIQDEQVALVAFQTAEIDWKNGRLSVDQYAGASRLYSDVRIKTEAARGTLFTSLQDLSTLIGVSLAGLKAN